MSFFSLKFFEKVAFCAVGRRILLALTGGDCRSLLWRLAAAIMPSCPLRLPAGWSRIVAICVVTVVFIPPLRAEKRIQVDSETKIIFEKYDNSYFKLKRYLRTVDNLTSLLLHSRHNIKLEPKLVVIDPKKMPHSVNIVPVGRAVNIYVSSDLHRWRDDAVINKKLLEALLFTKCDIVPGRAALPDWLLTALYAEVKIKTTRKIFSPSEYLPGVMALARAGIFPKLSTLILHPVPAKDSASYRLYEEFCLFLLSKSKQLCRKDKDTFAEIVMLSATGNYSQQEIFNSTIGRVADSRYRVAPAAVGSGLDKAELWFRDALRRKGANCFFPLSAEETNRKFNQLFPLQCEVKVGKGEYKTFALQLLQLPKFWSRLKEPFKVRRQLADRIGQLALQAPAVMALQLHNIRKEISTLGDDSPTAETGALNRALINYQKSFVQQDAVDSYLDKVEQRPRYLNRYYQRLLQVIDRQREVPWPALNRYLDEVEKRYLN